MFRSNRVKAHHIGIGGNLSEEWSYRLLLSYMKHWGTYKVPFDRIMRQGSTLAEVMYKPKKYAGWNFSLALGYDKGSYIGDSMGCMVTITKTGLLWSR